MELREDEIEALLKLEGKELIVGHADGQYIAIIRGWYDDVQDTRSISRVSTEGRLKAVHEVWEAYQEFLSRPAKDKCTQHAYLQNAVGNIDIEYIKGKRK